MFNHGAIIGLPVRQSDKTLGVITNSYHEDKSHIIVINDDYEIVVSSCELIIDLIRNETYVRAKE